jgi:hypothetical protein
VIAGLANNWWEKLLVAGTYITRPYPPEGTANKPPAGITLERFGYQPPTSRLDGWARATFQLEPGASYPLSQHRPGILLVDMDKIEAVSLDYHKNLLAQSAEDGNLRSERLMIPKSASMPKRLQAFVMLDVYPFYQQLL